jgi:hypothetical protein
MEFKPKTIGDCIIRLFSDLTLTPYSDIFEQGRWDNKLRVTSTFTPKYQTRVEVTNALTSYDKV